MFNELVALWYFTESAVSIGKFSHFNFFSFLSAVLSLFFRTIFFETVQVNLRANAQKDGFFFMFNAD